MSNFSTDTLLGHRVTWDKVQETGRIKEKKALARAAKKFIIIEEQDAMRHETLGTSPEGTVHNLENKI